MFQNRIGLDFTFYYNRTKNQILDAPMDPTTGYSKATINSGCVRNRGYEIQLDVTPVVSRDFRWNATFTWSKNENKIISLAEGASVNQQYRQRLHHRTRGRYDRRPLGLQTSARPGRKRCHQ
jgi:outer membrane receptor protein involved in Fe transport